MGAIIRNKRMQGVCQTEEPAKKYIDHLNTCT